MTSLIMVILSIVLMAAMLMISVNYLPAWRTVSASSETVTLNALHTLKGAFAAAWVADNPTSYQTNTYTDPPVINNADGGLAANFSAYAFLPGAPAGYAWLYGHTAGGFSWFCMYPIRGSGGASQGVYNGMRAALRDFGANANEVFMTAGKSRVCGSTTNSGAPSRFPANYVITLFVHCTPKPSPTYSQNGAVLCDH